VVIRADDKCCFDSHLAEKIRDFQPLPYCHGHYSRTITPLHSRRIVVPLRFTGVSRVPRL
jgi:hypothetical protein